MPNHWRLLTAVASLCIASGLRSDAAPKSHTLKIEISFPATAHEGAITGRVFFMMIPVKADACSRRRGPPPLESPHQRRLLERAWRQQYAAGATPAHRQRW